MNSVALTIRTDAETKKTLADFAKSIGLSLSSFATATLLQAVREKRVLLTPRIEPTPYLVKTMKNELSDRKKNQNYTTITNEAELDNVFKTV
jgi:antitoxin component of RelBE/YafQ-DinJ toxin-antitoxin module